MVEGVGVGYWEEEGVDPSEWLDVFLLDLGDCCLGWDG